ncbi:hypothetical protein Lalb_Chr19g0128411 [Lupinus albus]|uniref:Uncharacterized protein n=1 Tax=Lupinus albus TaxID=3870 RepID=A0A6A4NSF9_LUPAL|nr:hypothetical protein Lalb_Chr19g0128411 [Lupinus albus]
MLLTGTDSRDGEMAVANEEGHPWSGPGWSKRCGGGEASWPPSSFSISKHRARRLWFAKVREWIPSMWLEGYVDDLSSHLLLLGFLSSFPFLYNTALYLFFLLLKLCKTFFKNFV